MDVGLSLAMEVTEDTNMHVKNNVKSLFHRLPGRGIHSPELLEPYDCYLTELSPADVACVHEMGKAASDVRCPSLPSMTPLT